MKRYYILVNKNNSIDKPFYSIGFKDFVIVSTKGEPIGNNCFYRARKWCGKVWYWLYDVPTGTYISRVPTLEGLKYYVENEQFKNELKHVRKSKFYSSMMEHFNKALEEYKERVKGGEK